jgi:Spy/CpxP family protein refolding chaperone
VTRRLAAVTLALACGLASTAADAQPRRADPAGGARVDERRERIKKRIRALRAYTLTDELGLDEATAAKVFPILSKYDDQIGKQLAARHKLRGDLDAAIARGDTKAIDPLIDDLVANQKALWAIDEKRFAELRKVLTPQQAAKLLVVLPALERKVQRLLERAVSGREPGRGGRGRGRGRDDRGDDDDDDVDDDDDDDDDLGRNPYRR